MLDFAILGILTDGPLHGYELKRVLADSEHGFWTVSFGSLYPALRRLEKQGYVSVGMEGGSRRKVYQLTPEGKAYFQELLEAPGAAEEPHPQADQEHPVRAQAQRGSQRGVLTQPPVAVVGVAQADGGKQEGNRGRGQCVTRPDARRNGYLQRVARPARNLALAIVDEGDAAPARDLGGRPGRWRALRHRGS